MITYAEYEVAVALLSLFRAVYPDADYLSEEEEWEYREAIRIMSEYGREGCKPAPRSAPRAAKPPYPPGGKLESFANDVMDCVKSGDDAGLLELYCEAGDKRNEYARAKYMRVYDYAVAHCGRRRG